MSVGRQEPTALQPCRLSTLYLCVEIGAHAWTEPCFARLAGARVAHVGLCNETIPRLDLEVLDYSVCLSARLRLVCLSRSGQSHRSSSQSDSRLMETRLGPEMTNSLFFTRSGFHSSHSVLPLWREGIRAIKKPTCN